MRTSLNVQPTDAHYWEDSAWINPPFTDYRIAELDIYTFTPEGTVAAATRQLGQLAQTAVNAVVINPDTLFSITSARQLCDTDEVPATDEAEQLRHFIDVCHFEGIAVCVDLALTPADTGTFTHNTYGFSDSQRRAFLDSAVRWLRDFHADALRLPNAVPQPVLETLARQLRREANALTKHTGRQYYVLVDCGDSPVALMGHYKGPCLCQVGQSEQTTLTSLDDQPDTQKAYSRDYLYEHHFAQALNDLFEQTA